MKAIHKTVGLFSALAIGVAAWAGAAESQMPKGSQEQKGSQQKGAPQQGSGVDASPMGSPHSMTGQITKLNKQQGTFSVKTDEGILDLRLPPSALQNLKQGDRVTIELALKPAGSSPSPGASPGSEPGAPKGPKGPGGQY